MAYKHINSNERFYLEQRLALGDSISKIAKDLGRHKSSLYNEINRNTDQSFGFYSGLRANNIAKERQSLTVRKQKFFANVDKQTMELINTEFKVRSSPDQISAKLKNELNVEVSQQTIYRHVWEDRNNGGKLYEHLRRRGKKYRNKSTKKEAIKNKQSIEKRELFNVLEKEVGHYEMDTIFGLDQKSFLLTHVTQIS
jgi:IS30 family transposase